MVSPVISQQTTLRASARTLKATMARKDAFSFSLIFLLRRASDRTLDWLQPRHPQQPTLAATNAGGKPLPASLLLGLLASSQNKPDSLWHGLFPAVRSLQWRMVNEGGAGVPPHSLPQDEELCRF